MSTTSPQTAANTPEAGAGRLVTVESVAAVREKLLAAKQRPSVRAVIRELGGGSPNDVAPILRELESKQPAVKTVMEQVSKAYSEIADRAATAEENYAQMLEASAAHERRIKDLESLLAGARADVQRHTGELSARTEELAQVRKEAAGRVQDIEARLAAAQQQAADLEHRVARAESQAKEADGRVEEIRASSEKRGAQLQAEIEKLREQLATVTQERNTASEAAAVAKASLAGESRRADQAEAREATLLTEVKALREQANGANAQLAAAIEREGAHKVRIAELSAQVERLTPKEKTTDAAATVSASGTTGKKA